MSTRIYYRGPIIWNLILFVVFSFVFVYLQEIFKGFSSVTNRTYFLYFIKGHIPFVSILGLTLLMFLFQTPKLGKLGFFLSTVLTSALTIINLNFMFSKFVLILLFFYILIAYYFFQFYEVEYSESYYKSQIDEELLYPPMLHRIETCGEAANDKKFFGYLTNWSKEGCYIYLSNPENIKGRVSIEVSFQDHKFKADGIVVAREKNNHGIGVKILTNANEESLNGLGWSEFYEIIGEMGLKPELLL